MNFMNFWCIHVFSRLVVNLKMSGSNNWNDYKAGLCRQSGRQLLALHGIVDTDCTLGVWTWPHSLLQVAGSAHSQHDATLKKHPSILAKFEAGKFTVHKTTNKFSAMAIDQYHEQNNAIIKQSGGTIALTTNPSALRHWMVAGSEVLRIVIEFENCALGTQADSSDTITTMNSM